MKRGLNRLRSDYPVFELQILYPVHFGFRRYLAQEGLRRCGNLSFFGKVEAGETPSAVLSHTKRDFAQGSEGQQWRNPAYWTAFSFFGSD